MFRTTSHLRIFRNLLRHTNIASRCPAAHYKVQVRDPCPPKLPPPPPPPKDDSGFWGAMTVVFIATGFAIVAKQNPEIRDWLTIYAPWFDDFIAVIFEENMSYGVFGRKCLQDAINYITHLVKKDDKPKPCSMKAVDKENISVPEASAADKDTGSIDPDKPVCEKPPKVVVRKTACEIVAVIKENGNDILSNYYTAVRACSLYNQIVDDTMANFSIPTLKELHGHMAERINLVKTSIKNIEEAITNIDKAAVCIKCAKGSKEERESAKTLIKYYQEQIIASKIQWDRENDKSIALDSQWQKVEFLIDKYSDENETMFSDIKYDQNKLSYNGDVDVWLYHTYRYANQLKTDLKDMVSGMTDRVNRAFATLPDGDKERKNRDYMVQYALNQKRAEMDKEYRKRYDDLWAANNERLKQALKEQVERDKELVEKRLTEVEKKATVKLNKLVSEKVAFEKMLFAHQLQEMSTKLRLVEDKLNVKSKILKARLKAESETRRSQELWAAGAGLLAATHSGESVVSVDRELKAIEKASGDGDKLVETVLKAIPPSIREKGLVPESVLRARYHELEKTALKVALVEQDGGPLPVYLLSLMMSMLLFMKISGIPQEEVDNPPKEPFDDMDTYDLLRRARFWLERGNLSAAVRYVSSLKGASLAAMLSWRDSAHAHLETRQAAEAILAHAAALALQYI